MIPGYGQGGELLSSKNAENWWEGETIGKEGLPTKLESKCQWLFKLLYTSDMKKEIIGYFFQISLKIVTSVLFIIWKGKCLEFRNVHLFIKIEIQHWYQFLQCINI